MPAKKKAKKRPSNKFAKFSEVRRIRYLGRLAAGSARMNAARSAGVSYELIRMYRKAHPEFSQEEEAAELEACGAVEGALFTSAIKGNVTAQQVYLYNRAPDRWKDKRAASEMPALLNAHADNENRSIIQRERIAIFEREFAIAQGTTEDVPADAAVDNVGERVLPPHPDGPANSTT